MVAERDNLVSLVDLCMQLLEEDDDVEFNKIDLDPGNELNDMDVESLDSIDMDNDPIEIPDLVFDTDNAFDELDVMFAATTAYGQYILQDLESNIDFTKPPLRVANLSDVECVDNFHFHKDDLIEFFDLLRKPLEGFLEFKQGSTDVVLVRNQYTS
jgi:hypothetical protein